MDLFLLYFLHSSSEVEFNYSLVLLWVLARFHLDYVSICQFENITANCEERNPESLDLMLGKVFWFSSISMTRKVLFNVLKSANNFRYIYPVPQTIEEVKPFKTCIGRLLGEHLHNLLVVTVWWVDCMPVIRCDIVDMYTCMRTARCGLFGFGNVMCWLNA